MTVKEFVEEGLRQGLITILVSLNVKGALNAAWWLSILKTLKDFNFPRNLYYLTRSYFSQRTAAMSTNTIQVEREVRKDAHKDPVVDQDIGIFNTTLFLIWNL